jgi:hypothetical protein
MKKNDWILIFIVLAVAGLIFWWHNQIYSETGETVKVIIDNETMGTYSLQKNQIIELNQGTNVLSIYGGKVKMESANCPDQICVNHSMISKNGENIVCLPNKIVVEIISKKSDGDVDAVAD